MRFQRSGRREFVALIGGAAAWPLIARAQQPKKIPKVGLLAYAPFWQPLLETLREKGYVEDQTIVFEKRPDPDQPDRIKPLAVDLVLSQVDVIVTFGAVATLAARSATTSTPIVMIGVGDPLGTGLVPSLARPGGNITGNTIFGAELGAKRLELLREMIPSVTRVAFLWNSANPANALHLEEVQRGAAAFGITLISTPAATPEAIGSALATTIEQRPQALLMTADPMHQLHAAEVIEFAAGHRLPTMHQLREHAHAGGLMAYGANSADLLRRGALYVDKILKGAKPADLPVEQPTKFDLVINLKTAKALGIEVPPMLLVRADEIIE
jgi:putative tryptophan/tyrosine transport system substrate-binding protein